MGNGFRNGGAGGFAQGLQSGASIFQQIQNQRQRQEVLELQKQQQAFAQEQQLKEQKIKLDTLKLQADQRKKQEELQSRFFESLSGQGGQATQGGVSRASAGNAPSAGPSGSSLGGNPGALLSLAAQSGQLPAFNAAAQQGIIETPTGQQQAEGRELSFLAKKLDILQKENELKQLAADAPFRAEQQGLDVAKTKAEIKKLQAQTQAALRAPQAKLPTKASLALDAAGGDPVEALKFLDTGGLELTTNPDGTFSFSTKKAKPSQKLFNDAVTGIQDIKSSMIPLKSLRDLVASNPTSPTAQGQLRLISTTLAGQIAAFQPTGPTGKEIQKRITQSGDVSKLEFFGEMAAFSLARINNPDGKISDADVASSRKALGLGDGLFSRPGSAADIIARLDAAFIMAEAKSEIHQDTLKLLGGGRIQDRQGNVVPAALPTAPQPAPVAPTPPAPVAPSAPVAPPAPAAPAGPTNVLELPATEARETLEFMTETERNAFFDSLTPAQVDALLKKLGG